MRSEVRSRHADLWYGSFLESFRLELEVAGVVRSESVAQSGSLLSESTVPFLPPLAERSACGHNFRIQSDDSIQYSG